MIFKRNQKEKNTIDRDLEVKRRKGNILAQDLKEKKIKRKSKKKTMTENKKEDQEIGAVAPKLKLLKGIDRLLQKKNSNRGIK